MTVDAGARERRGPPAVRMVAGLFARASRACGGVGEGLQNSSLAYMCAERHQSDEDCLLPKHSSANARCV